MTDDPLEYFQREKRFDSVAEVVRTVEVYAGDRPYRVEVLKNYGNAAVPYTTLCWTQMQISIDGEEQSFWVKHDLPWTAGKTPDEVLAEALGFLADEQPKRKTATT
jgi:hypothetical protein